MAKRGVPEHPKTLRLARLLGVEPWAAVGLLEVFWHWSCRYAITGVINHSPEDLADGIRYRGDAQAMFSALVTAGWIDEVEGVGFVIHDIADHADNTWKANLKRSGKRFWVHSLPDHNTVTTESQLSCEPPEPEPEPEPDIHTQAGQSGKHVAESTILHVGMPPEWLALPEPQQFELLAQTRPFAEVVNADGRPCYVLDDFDTMPATLAAWQSAGLMPEGRQQMADEWANWHAQEGNKPHALPAVALRGSWLTNALTAQARRASSAATLRRSGGKDMARSAESLAGALDRLGGER